MLWQQAQLCSIKLSLLFESGKCTELICWNLAKCHCKKEKTIGSLMLWALQSRVSHTWLTNKDVWHASKWVTVTQLHHVRRSGVSSLETDHSCKTDHKSSQMHRSVSRLNKSQPQDWPSLCNQHCAQVSHKTDHNESCNSLLFKCLTSQQLPNC